MLGEEVGLIEFALAQAFRVKGNGHKGIERLPGEAWILETLGKYPAEGFGDPYFAAVFHTMYQLAYDTTAPNDRDGAFEMKSRATAIGTLKLASESRKLLGTNLAARRSDELYAFLASFAEVQTRHDPLGTSSAVRREKE